MRRNCPRSSSRVKNFRRSLAMMKECNAFPHYCRVLDCALAFMSRLELLGEMLL